MRRRSPARFTRASSASRGSLLRSAGLRFWKKLKNSPSGATSRLKWPFSSTASRRRSENRKSKVSASTVIALIPIIDVPMLSSSDIVHANSAISCVGWSWRTTSYSCFRSKGTGSPSSPTCAFAYIQFDCLYRKTLATASRIMSVTQMSMRLLFFRADGFGSAKGPEQPVLPESHSSHSFCAIAMFGMK